MTLDGEKVDTVLKINDFDNGGYAKIEATCGDTADIIWNVSEWKPDISNIKSFKVTCII